MLVNPFSFSSHYLQIQSYFQYLQWSSTTSTLWNGRCRYTLRGITAFCWVVSSFLVVLEALSGHGVTVSPVGPKDGLLFMCWEWWFSGDSMVMKWYVMVI